MKLDLNQLSASQEVTAAVPHPTATASAARTSAPQAATQDRATLSTSSDAVASLVSQAMQSPAVRQDKVDALRQQIAGGTYSIDPQKIAEGITSESKGK